MPSTPYAKLLYKVNSGANTSGGQTVAGGATINLLGENTGFWTSQLFEIYEYPTGFALPSGWTNINGVYQYSSSSTPPVFTVPLPNTGTWGKYLFRLTVNQGFLNGVYVGTAQPQPLVDILSGVRVLSVNGLDDVAAGESNQFDTFRQWISGFKNVIRSIDSALSSGVAGTPWHNSPNTYKSTAYTFLTTDFTVVVTANTGVTYKLPAAPIDGDMYQFNDQVGGNIFSGNGHNLQFHGGAVATRTTAQFDTVTVKYNGNASVWMIQ